MALFGFLLTLIANVLADRAALIAENLALRQQLTVLRRSVIGTREPLDGGGRNSQILPQCGCAARRCTFP